MSTHLSREQQLVRRFLALPFRHQLAVSRSMGVFTGADCALFNAFEAGSDQALFKELFKRSAERGLLDRLFEEVKKLHDADFDAMVAKP